MPSDSEWAQLHIPFTQTRTDPFPPREEGEPINDREDYIAGAYRRTEERIASGQVVNDAEPDADYASNIFSA